MAIPKAAGRRSAARSGQGARKAKPGLRLNEHIEEPGEVVFRHACKLGLEGNRLEADRIALQTARFLKSRNPHSLVKLKDLQTGEETVVAFKSGQ